MGDKSGDKREQFTETFRMTELKANEVLDVHHPALDLTPHGICDRCHFPCQYDGEIGGEQKWRHSLLNDDAERQAQFATWLEQPKVNLDQDQLAFYYEALKYLDHGPQDVGDFLSVLSNADPNWAIQPAMSRAATEAQDWGRLKITIERIADPRKAFVY